MKSAAVFKNGPSSQAVRIPREYHLATREVWIERTGDVLTIRPKPDSWDDFFYSSRKVSDDFSMDRGKKLPKSREDFDE